MCGNSSVRGDGLRFSEYILAGKACCFFTGVLNADVYMGLSLMVSPNWDLGVPVFHPAGVQGTRSSMRTDRHSLPFAIDHRRL